VLQGVAEVKEGFAHIGSRFDADGVNTVV